MYKFERINEDEFNLDFNGKKYKIKRDVEIAKRIQSIDSEAFMLAMQDLTNQGYTAQNNPYIVERIVDGKEIIDESNWNFIIDTKKKEATVLIVNDIFKRLFNLQMVDFFIINGVDLENDKDNIVENFETDLIILLTRGEIRGETKTPSNAS